MKNNHDNAAASHEEAMAEVRCVVAEAKELSQVAGGALTDSLATWMAGRYAIDIRRLAAESKNGALDSNQLRVLCHDLVDLRRGDHSAESLRVERERLEMDRAKQKEVLEKLFWEWAKQNEDKICHRPTPTPKQQERRIKEILGISLDDDIEDDSDDDYSI